MSCPERFWMRDCAHTGGAGDVIYRVCSSALSSPVTHIPHTDPDPLKHSAMSNISPLLNIHGAALMWAVFGASLCQVQGQRGAQRLDSLSRKSWKFKNILKRPQKEPRSAAGCFASGEGFRADVTHISMTHEGAVILVLTFPRCFKVTSGKREVVWREGRKPKQNKVHPPEWFCRT